MVQVEVLKFIGFVTEISPKAFINRRNELILVPTKNIYFIGYQDQRTKG